ncbi:protein gamma response 1 [Vitis riparia]|uniref:protein gamma response 1 n=1 Tax=Vitis riparia TaxID=96939 RepID=UPI00155B12C7|nr:protein gamma response 1 [Vitis riparia]XP_034703411.1 protein gamma response 1 [Vitis riparia]
MEWNIENSPDRGLPTNSGDIKYLSGLSTILVATIQEAKDRISQVEYIFCTQLFPNIQSKFKIYSEAIKTVEDAWKKKENDLLLQIESLKLEKQQALGENQSLKLEKATLLEEKEEKTNPLLTKLQSLEKEVGVLKRELLQKSKEVDEGMELQNKLIQLIEKKSSAIVTKGKQLKEQEEKKSEVVAKLQSLEKKVDELQQKLKEKTEEIVKGKELQENLFKKIESQDSKMMSNEFLLNDREKEMKLLIDQIKHLKKNADELQTELQKRNEEVEEGRKLQEHLLKQIDLNGLNTLKNEQQLEEHEKKEKMLLTKIKGLEERVNELQVEVNGKSNEVTDGGEWHQNFLQQIELKSSELLSEKKKRRDVVAAYKKLKSQYNFLSSKLGLTTENVLTPVKIEEENDSLMHHVNPLNSPGPENTIPETSAAACEANKQKNVVSFPENLDSVKRVGLIQSSSCQSPSSSGSAGASKCTTNLNSSSLAGTKRPSSSWRDTRSRQCQGGADPHDDFLDTPLENIKGNLNKAKKEEYHDLPVAIPKDMNFDSSDDETQDVNVEPSQQKQPMPAPKPGTRVFKYVEPVRTKAERENLQGIECKQCKKFYDAVLPKDGNKDTDGNKRNFRCEHHEGVSRHRYRYVPPMTPEGFWNIGFDSEM